MTDLIERLERADGPSRELDWAISDLLFGQQRPLPWPPYTASIDAAMTLVPEGWRAGFEQAGAYDRSDLAQAWLWPFESSFNPDWQCGEQGYRDAEDGQRGYAKTPALALCIAALRAKEADNG